jgi:hypothetical protein
LAKYYSVPKDIETEIDKMVSIDDTKIEEELENNITFESIITKYLYDTTDTLIEQETKLNTKRRELRTKYITGNTDNDDEYSNLRVNKTELDSVVETHRDVIVLRQKVKELENVISFYERTLQTIRNKNYTLKNLIEFRKFQAGG